MKYGILYSTNLSPGEVYLNFSSRAGFTRVSDTFFVGGGLSVRAQISHAESSWSIASSTAESKIPAFSQVVLISDAEA